MANHDGDHQPQFELAVTPQLGRRHSSAPYSLSTEDGEIKLSPSHRMSLHQTSSGNQKSRIEVATRSGMSLKDSEVNKRDDQDRTPLIIAAREGNEMSVQLLLRSPTVDIHAKARGGITALHVASFSGNANVVKLLLQDSNAITSTPTLELLSAQADPELFTALHMAACNKSEAVVRAIWDAYKVTVSSKAILQKAVNAEDCIGWTPLHYAAWQGNTRVVEELLSWAPLDVNAGDKNGFTALHLASWKGYTEVVKLLLNHCDQENVTDLEPNKAASSNIRTLEFIATLQKDVDWMKLPRPRLADYTIREKRSNVTPLHYAVEQNREEVVHVLLENPSIDVHLEDSEKNSAIDVALSNKNSKLLWELLGNFREKIEVYEKLRSALSKRGVKNFIAKGHERREKKLNNCGELLKMAMEKNKLEEVLYLLQELETELADMNVKIRDIKTNVTLLHHAAFAGLEKLVEIIVAIPGLEINEEDSDKQTPLHYAAVAGRANVVRILIRADCRANAEDIFGRTALQVAVESRKHDVEKVLLDQPDVRDYVERFYRNRQVFVDAANAMLLGAALIASVTFAGWLQPPAGFTPYHQLVGPTGDYENYASVEQHLSMRVFWVFNSLSFFCAIATVIAGAGAVLPTLDVFIGQEVKFVKRTLVATSTLLLFSLIFILGAFAAAGYASLPPIPKYQRIMTLTVIFGVSLCLMSFLWFLKRLYGIRPSWWRNLERAIQPRKRIVEKVKSARYMFSQPSPD